MNENYLLFKEKFNYIKNLGWIKCLRSGPTGVGYTFEKLLGKDEDFFPLSDFYGIEVKTHRKKSNFNITLFNAAPDGEEFLRFIVFMINMDILVLGIKKIKF